VLISTTDQISGVCVLRLVRMDWERRGKRPFEEANGEEGWRCDQDLRQKLDREQEEHRRQQRDFEFQRRREEDNRARDRRSME
jgi:hypothetical protein